MRFVIATPLYPPEIGVLANYAAGIEGALRKAGHTVEVVSFGSLMSLPRGIRHGVYFVRLLFALRGADRVLALDTWSVGVPALFAAKLTRTPLILRIGGDYLWEQYVERTGEDIRLSDFYTQPRRLSRFERVIRAFTRMIVRNARTVFFNTRFQKDIWERAYGSTGAKVLENVYPQKLPFIAPSTHLFVASNRPTRYKNAARFKAAFAKVKETHPEIALDEAFVSHEKQAARFAASYATVVPSLSEVGSNIAIESVAAGRPFIITEDTGTRERLSDCGLFVDTRDEAALKRAIEDMLDKDIYARLLRHIQAFAFTRTWDEVAEEIMRHV